MMFSSLAPCSAQPLLAPIFGALLLTLACGAEPSDLAGSARNSLKREVPEASARHVSDAAKKGFNPQPEPPGIDDKAHVSDAAKKGFNPQPEPPADDDRASAAHVSDAAKKGFNPQPEPPAVDDRASAAHVSDAAKKGFNPQPEPPGKEIQPAAR